MKKLLPLLALVAMPALAKPVLTVYTYDSFSADWGPGPAVKKAFEADCGCELKYVALEDGVSLLNRLRMEGKNSKADVVLGLDNNLLDAASKTGLFAKSGVAADAVNVPGGWNNDTSINPEPLILGHFHCDNNPQQLIITGNKQGMMKDSPKTHPGTIPTPSPSSRSSPSSPSALALSSPNRTHSRL